ncbi:21 kDa protein [Quillaja saponaria]|uniref:21 kDa protein n=1 Tax=Quillaja saponaria TaxID=32244 RepID=A0AAD7QJI0_QUISA|nr:21 kDa protein [Quillaja saponaria]
MDKSSLLFLLLSILYIAGIANLASAATASNFIKSSCRTTKYPAVCVQSLSIYADTIKKSSYQLSQAALSVCLDRVVSAKTFIYRLTKFKGLKPGEKEAIRDCFDEISDSVDRLRRSIKELKNGSSAEGQEFIWHISNVVTWVSASLTDENTCVDGFSGKALNGRIKRSIMTRMINIEQVTTNALSLINNYASKY